MTQRKKCTPIFRATASGRERSFGTRSRHCALYNFHVAPVGVVSNDEGLAGQCTLQSLPAPVEPVTKGRQAVCDFDRHLEQFLHELSPHISVRRGKALPSGGRKPHPANVVPAQLGRFTERKPKHSFCSGRLHDPCGSGSGAGCQPYRRLTHKIRSTQRNELGRGETNRKKVWRAVERRPLFAQTGLHFRDAGIRCQALDRHAD